METILFYILAVTSVVLAIFAITRVNPLSTAVFLIGCFISIAGLFGLLAAPLIAIFQILLAAGAIMVLFVFVIMLIKLDAEAFAGRPLRVPKIVGAFLAAYLLAIAAIAIIRPPFSFAPTISDSYSDTQTFGNLLVGNYAIPFELLSVLLLAAMVSAVAIGRRRTR